MTKMHYISKKDIKLPKRKKDGKKGDNVQCLNVYGREGEPCVRCKTPLTKIRLGGRGTHFCSICQKILTLFLNS